MTARCPRPTGTGSTIQNMRPGRSIRSFVGSPARVIRLRPSSSMGTRKPKRKPISKLAVRREVPTTLCSPGAATLKARNISHLRSATSSQGPILQTLSLTQVVAQPGRSTTLPSFMCGLMRTIAPAKCSATDWGKTLQRMSVFMKRQTPASS